MAYAKQTFNDLMTSLSYRYGESSAPTTGVDNRKYWVNRGIEFCMDRLQFSKVATVTVASGVCSLSVSTADAAPDFKSFDKLLNSSGYEIKKVSQEDFTASGEDVCCVTGDHLNGYILKAKTDGTYSLYYQFYISPLVATTDICIIPDPEAVVAYAYAQIRMSETDPLQDAQINMDECFDRIGRMNEDIVRNEGQLTFKVLY